MKKLVAILGLLLISSTVFAEHPRNRLYKVSSNMGVSYILGTMHIGVGINDFKTDVAALIKKSKMVLPEIDMTPKQLATYKVDPFKAMFEVTPLPNKINTDSETVRKLEALGFPRYIAERLPDNACMSLQTLLMAKPNLPSLDFQVIAIAHQNKLKVLPLDTMELRKSARNESDAANGACSLQKLLAEYSKEQIWNWLNSSLADSIKFYKSGESEKEETLDDPIVKTRNLAWMPIIEKEMKKGTTFVSVGYAHLGGRNGILQLLSNRGYRITLIE